jgi:hypothetical protein
MQPQKQQQPAYTPQLVPQFTPTRSGMPPPPVFAVHRVPLDAPTPPPATVHLPPSTQTYYDASRDPRFPVIARMCAATTGGSNATAQPAAQPAAPALGDSRPSVVFPTSQQTPTAGEDEWTRVPVTHRRQAINLGATAPPRAPPAPAPAPVVPAPDAPAVEMAVLESESDLEEAVDESAPPALVSSASESAFVESEEAEVLPSPSANKRARARAPPDANAYDAAIATVLANADAGRPRRERRAPARYVPGANCSAKPTQLAQTGPNWPLPFLPRHTFAPRWVTWLCLVAFPEQAIRSSAYKRTAVRNCNNITHHEFRHGGQ